MPNSTKPSAAKLKGVTLKWLPPLRRVCANGRAWALVAVVVVVVGAWRGVILLQRPAGIGKITNEFGSVAEFFGEPVPNAAGTRILFQQTTENGIGVFFSVLPNGRRVLLDERPTKGFDRRDILSAGWSPGDRQFALARKAQVANATGSEILVCDGETGTNLATVKLAGTVNRLVWLSAETIAYVDELQTLHKVETFGGNRWRPPVPFQAAEVQVKGKKVRRPTKAERDALLPVRRLAAATADAVLFLRGPALWTWKFGEPAPVKIWETPTNELVNFWGELNSPQILLQTRGKDGTSFFRLGGRGNDAAPVKITRAAESLGDQVVWLPGGGRAWLQGLTLWVQDPANKEPTRVEFVGGVNCLVGQGTELYLVGSRAGEPVGIWKYEVRKADGSCVVSNALPTFQCAKAVVPTRERITNPEGRVISYRLWAPPKLAPGRRYPLVVGRIDAQRWFEYPALVANGGAYFMSVDQPSAPGDWEAALLSACNHAASNRRIDPDNWYLYGYSGESSSVASLLENQPEKWRGAVLFSPGGLPDLRRLAGKRLLLDRGAEDRFTTHLTKYRDEALLAGVEVTLAVQAGAGHNFFSLAAMRERDEALMKFLFGR
jgi:hypothetical protein